MTLPASGPITIGQLQAEFGGPATSPGLFNYMRGNGWLQDYDAAPNYPTNAVDVAMSYFYSAAKASLSSWVDASRNFSGTASSANGWFYEATASVGVSLSVPTGATIIAAKIAYNGSITQGTYASASLGITVRSGSTVLLSTGEAGAGSYNRLTNFTTLPTVAQANSLTVDYDFGVSSVDEVHPGTGSANTSGSPVVIYIWYTGGTGVAVSLSLTASTSGTRVGAGTATTPAVTAVASNGWGTRSFSWTLKSGTALTLSSTNTDTTSFSYSFGGTGSVSAVYTCTVTDSSGSAPRDISVTLSATAATYSISGAISGAGGPGATVGLSGAATASTTADGSGNYSFSGLSNGSYTVTPSKTGYTFSPSSQGATVSGANVGSVNFSSTQNGSGLSFSVGINTNTFDVSGDDATTQAFGNLTFTVTGGSGSYVADVEAISGDYAPYITGGNTSSGAFSISFATTVGWDNQVFDVRIWDLNDYSKTIATAAITVYVSNWG